MKYFLESENLRCLPVAGKARLMRTWEVRHFWWKLNVWTHCVKREIPRAILSTGSLVKQAGDLCRNQKDIERAVNDAGRIVVSGKIYCFLLIWNWNLNQNWCLCHSLQFTHNWQSQQHKHIMNQIETLVSIQYIYYQDWV